MSSGNVFERLFKLNGTIAKLVMDGKRNPKEVADVLQTIVDGNPNLSILEFISTVGVSSTTSPFSAKDRFVINTDRKAKVKISDLGGNFTKWFLSGSGKIEDPITEQVLRCHRLRQTSADTSIIAELGDETKAETTLTELYSLMEKQGNGEDGVLLNNGYANIFYIRDQNGVLRAVYAFWHGFSWLMYACELEGPSGWCGGYLVFSRNSILESSVPAVASS